MLQEKLVKITEKFTPGELANFRKTFTDLDDDILDKLYWSDDSISGLIYMDCQNQVIFETRIYAIEKGYVLLQPTNSHLTASEVIELVKDEYIAQIAQGNEAYVKECMMPFAYKEIFNTI